MTEDQRRKVWLHNSYFGHCRMMFVQLEGIKNSSTTSEATKNIANDLQEMVELLQLSLKERIDD